MVGWAVIAGPTAIPVPVIWMVRGELNCELTIEQLPEEFPIVAGAKLTVNVKLLPGDRLNGSDAPPMLKPAPVALAWEIATTELPEFVTLKL